MFRQPCLVILVALVGFVSSQTTARAGIVLVEGGFEESFDDIANGLRDGITVRLGATRDFLGTDVTATDYTAAPTSWATPNGDFRNMASTDGLTVSSTPQQQANSTDRSLGVRQTDAFGDTGAAFVFEFENTIGFEHFSLDFEAHLGDLQPRSSTFTVDFQVGANPTSFNPLGSFTLFEFGKVALSFDLSPNVDDQPLPLWIRIAALRPTEGSGFRDTIGIDDFRLSFSSVPEPSAGVLVGFVGLLGWSFRRQRHAAG